MNDLELSLSRSLSSQYGWAIVYELRLTTRRWLQYAEENLGQHMVMADWMDYTYLAKHSGSDTFVLLPKQILLESKLDLVVSHQTHRIPVVLNTGAKLSTRVMN